MILLIASTPSRVLGYPTLLTLHFLSSLHIFSLFSMLGLVKTLDGVDGEWFRPPIGMASARMDGGAIYKGQVALKGRPAIVFAGTARSTKGHQLSSTTSLVSYLAYLLFSWSNDLLFDSGEQLTLVLVSIWL